jgi:hypothetical protein
MVLSRTNLCRNPSFEVNTTDWTTTSTTLSRVGVTPFIGNHCAEAVSTNTSVNASADYGFTTTESVNPNQLVTASCYVKNISGATRSHRIVLDFVNSGGSVVGTENGTIVSVTAGGGYQRISVTGLAPANTVSYRINVRYQITSGLLGNTTLIDGVLIELGSTLDSYFDGNTQDEPYKFYNWLDTPDNSRSTLTLSDLPVQYEVRVNGVLLNDYNSITTTAGRQQVQDPFRAGTITITGSVLTEVRSLNIGDFLLVRVTRLFNTPSQYTIFSGTISDIIANFGYTEEMDSWTIQGEDFLADLGRAFTTDSWPAGLATSVAAAGAFNNTGVGLSYPISPTGSSKVSAYSWANENALNIVNTLIATEQGRIVSAPSVGVKDVEWYNRNVLNLLGEICVFTDGSAFVSGPQGRFQEIVFRSRADSFFTKTIVEPEGLASQSAGSGSRVFTMQSYDQTTAQASDLAAYVLATLDVSQDVPANISYIVESQDVAVGEFAIRSALDTLGGVRTIKIVLRGQVYTCFVEGYTYSATPSQTRIRLNLSSSEAAVGFVLDDENFGVLDTSKLGF